MKPPALVENLFRDLRDKRLLPVVGLLLVLLVAVPILLGGGDSPPSTAAAPGSATLGDTGADVPETEAVVLAEVPGIRDYRERLKDFQRKNPFRQQLSNPPKSATVAGAGDGTITELGTPAGGGGSATGAVDTTAQASGGTTDIPTDTTTDTTTGGTEKSGGGSGGGKSSQPADERFLITYEIDVKVGVVGDAEKRDGVKQGDFLPGNKRPVVLFAEGNQADGRAFFIVSSDVTKSSGDGNCIPARDNCQYLKMKVGDEQRFEYEPDGKTYRLKLNDVKLVEKPVKRSELRAEGGSASEPASPLASLFDSGF